MRRNSGLPSAYLLAACLGAGCATPSAGNNRTDGAPDGAEERPIALDTERETLGDAADDVADAAPSPAAPSKVSSGVTNFCATTFAGHVRCWGNNVNGQVGIGTFGNDPVLVPAAPVPGLAGVTQVTIGASVVAALMGGKVRVWGLAERGALGDGVVHPPGTSALKPTLVPGLKDIVQIGGGFHLCAVDTKARLWCWGDNTALELGYPTSETCLTKESDGTLKTLSCSTTPTLVPGIVGVAEVATSSDHTCVVLQTSGEVLCWGSNASGALGDGSTTDRAEPKPVLGLTDVQRLFAGVGTTCAWTTGSKLYCWGGDPLTGAAITTPKLVTGLGGDVAAMSLGQGHCALLTDGRVTCWGTGWNVPGAPFGTSAVPKIVPGLKKVRALGGSDLHTCGIQEDDSIICWGHVYLGDGSSVPSGTPTKVVW